MVEVVVSVKGSAREIVKKIAKIDSLHRGTFDGLVYRGVSLDINGSIVDYLPFTVKFMGDDKRIVIKVAEQTAIHKLRPSKNGIDFIVKYFTDLIKGIDGDGM